jgi:hypothetical protein
VDKLLNKFSYKVIFFLKKKKLAASFTIHPIIMKNDNVNKGRKSDMVHSKYMMTKLINNHLKKSGSEIEFIELPIDFNLLLFFLSFFSLPIKDGSFLQFFHPIFFNGEDRMKFINLVMEYRKTNITYFDHELDFGNTTRELDGIKNWTKKIPSGSLRDILKKFPRFDRIREENKYYNEIPNYMYIHIAKTMTNYVILTFSIDIIQQIMLMQFFLSSIY